MDVDHVEVALRAIAQKLPEESEACLAPSVGNRGSSEQSFAFERLHVLFVDFSCVSGAEVRLPGVVGLVRSAKLGVSIGVPRSLTFTRESLRKEVFGATLNCRVDCSIPAIVFQLIVYA